MTRYKLVATLEGYAIMDVKTSTLLNMRGDYSTILRLEELMNDAPNEEYCVNCGKRVWQGSYNPCCK